MCSIDNLPIGLFLPPNSSMIHILFSFIIHNWCLCIYILFLHEIKHTGKGDVLLNGNCSMLYLKISLKRVTFVKDNAHYPIWSLLAFVFYIYLFNLRYTSHFNLYIKTANWHRFLLSRISQLFTGDMCHVKTEPYLHYMPDEAFTIDHIIISIEPKADTISGSRSP